MLVIPSPVVAPAAARVAAPAGVGHPLHQRPRLRGQRRHDARGDRPIGPLVRPLPPGSLSIRFLLESVWRKRVPPMNVKTVPDRSSTKGPNLAMDERAHKHCHGSDHRFHSIPECGGPPAPALQPTFPLYVRVTLGYSQRGRPRPAGLWNPRS